MSLTKIGAATAALLSLAVVASAQDDQRKPSPIPTGVIPLPQGSPPTGQQSTVPKPVKPLPQADQPLAWSPKIEKVKAYVRGNRITMDDAIAIALYTSRPFASAIAALQQSSAQTGEAWALLIPNVGVGGQITEFDAPTKVSLAAFEPSGTGTGAAPAELVIVPQFNPVFTASLTLPIDLFGTLSSAANQAQFEELATRIDVNRVRNEIVYNVKNAFYNVLRAQAQLAVSTDNVNNAIERLNDANKNYGAGTNSRFDVITAQRDVADAQQSLITAHAQVSVNLAQLKNTIGLDLATHLNIADTGAVETPPGILPPEIPPQHPAVSGARRTDAALAQGASETTSATPSTPHPATPLNKDQGAPPQPGGQVVPLSPPPDNQVDDDFDFGPEYDGLVKQALATRPEILEAQARVTARKKGLIFARRSVLPSLSLSAQDVYTPNATGFTRENEGVFTLGVNVPLFDGGLAKERVREQKAMIANAEVNRRSAEDQVKLDVQQAYISLVQARQRVAVTNVEVSQARESFRVSQVRYLAGVSQQTGVSPQLELSNAQISLTQAESNRVNALYDYNVARAQLDHAMGRYAFVGAGPGLKDVPPAPKAKGN